MDLDANKAGRCSVCGRDFTILDAQNGFTIRRRLRYGMKHDGSMLYLKLCCTCMEDLIDRCVISPIMQEKESE